MRTMNNIFSRFGMWLQKFMYGRYGSDALSLAILILYIVLYILAQVFWWPVVAWLSLLLLFWSFFRMFSRNTAARYKENQKFLSVFRAVKRFFTGNSQRRKDKDHRYFKCPGCKNVLRVPKGKGKIQITCPVCRREFVKKT